MTGPKRRPRRPRGRPSEGPILYTTPTNSTPTPTPDRSSCWFGPGLPPAPAGRRWQGLCKTPECCNPQHHVEIPARVQADHRPPSALLMHHPSRWSPEEKRECWTQFPEDMALLFWRVLHQTRYMPEHFKRKCQTPGCTNPLHHDGLLNIPPAGPAFNPKDEIEALSLVTLSLNDLMTFFLRHYMPQNYRDVIRDSPNVYSFLTAHTDWR